ncbi:hypothetical protein GYMLUDRAFT_240839 [Collybiopsis luxurians FD-317 M1]|nr:hypothetical protein GYMLUDRAFT_240839 [Collybiopsis luxurians FD-317 M1]
MPFCNSWEETDTGFAKDSPTSVLLSDELQTKLCTKFLWHFIPTYWMVWGMEFKKYFMKLVVPIYAAHWPEDVTCGLKKTQHTCLSKHVVSPDYIDTSDWSQKAMPPWYNSKDQDKALEQNRLVRAMLYSFYKDNNLAYKHSLAQCTKEEACQVQLGLNRAVQNFFEKAIKEASPYIKSYSLPPLRWKISLYGGIFL